jgi:hypothetical protein
MAGADKRAKLLSDLMAAKGAAAGAAERAPEPDRAAVIQIAKRRPTDDRVGEAPPAPASVLYSKGAASASTFRPSYWSFDHDEATPAKPEPMPAPAAAAPPVAHAPKSRPLPINFVVAFGCVALFLSTTLFVMSQWHRGEPSVVSQPAPTPATTQAVVSPPVSPPVDTAVNVPLPAPAPPPVTPVPPSPAVAAPPAPVASATPAIVIDPPPPIATAESAVKPAVPVDPVPVVAPTPAAAPVAAPDTQQAVALLARGDDMLATGDVAAARLFYQRAAELGSAAAATAVGQTYDPGVLELLRVRGARGDVGTAAEWYRKAIAAGDRQAEIRLKRLLARTPG